VFCSRHAVPASDVIAYFCSSEDDDLAKPSGDSRSQSVLGEARPGGDEQAEAASRYLVPGVTVERLGIGAQDVERQRVGEDATSLQRLVRGPVPGGTECGSGCLLRQPPALMASVDTGRQVVPELPVRREA
jgi:hypothetical protein